MEVEKMYVAFKKLIVNDYPYLLEIDDDTFYPVFLEVFNDVLTQHSRINNKFFSNDGAGIIDFKFLDHYLIFCFRMANSLFKKKTGDHLADAIYYSSRIRTATDLYYTAVIDDYFMPVHSLGTVMDSRASYGKLLKIYNGVHIGPYKIISIKPENWIHPRFKDGVTLLANSSIYGSTEIGNNVIVSAGAIVINEKIPDNCIVVGKSPDLKVLPLLTSNMSLLNIPA